MNASKTVVPNRRVRKKQKTREKIIEAAKQMFLERGVDLTTVSNITEAADIAYGSFYNYFKSVPEMVPIVVEDTLIEHQHQVKELQQNYSDPVLRVTIGVRAFVQSLVKNPAITWLVQKPEVMVEAIANIMSEDALFDIRQGVESGDFTLPHGDINETWSTFCLWGCTGVLIDVAKNPGNSAAQTDNMTKTYLRILGVSDSKAEITIKSCPSIAN